MCSASKELCPGGPDPGPNPSARSGSRGTDDGAPLPVSDRGPGEWGSHGSWSPFLPLEQGTGGLSKNGEEAHALSPPHSSALALPALHSALGDLPLLLITFARYFLKKMKSHWHDSKDPGVSESEGNPKSHRGRCGVCAYPYLLPKALLLSRLFLFL